MTDISKARDWLLEYGKNAHPDNIRGVMKELIGAQSARIAELEAALVKISDLPTYECYGHRGDAIMDKCVDGGWIEHDAILALIPSNPTPEPTAAMFGLDGVDNDE